MFNEAHKSQGVSEELFAKGARLLETLRSFNVKADMTGLQSHYVAELAGRDEGLARGVRYSGNQPVIVTARTLTAKESGKLRTIVAAEGAEFGYVVG